MIKEGNTACSTRSSVSRVQYPEESATTCTSYRSNALLHYLGIPLPNPCSIYLYHWRKGISVFVAQVVRGRSRTRI